MRRKRIKPEGSITAVPSVGSHPSCVAGFTLIELIVAIVIVVGALLVTVAVIANSLGLIRATRDQTTAMNAARQMLETMQDSFDFSEIYRAYNSNPADDPDGPGTAPGPNFAAPPSLTIQPGDADGLAGEIVFPEIGGQLREDLDDPLLGMPMDLGNPPGIDTNNHAGNYKLLPVMVRVSWSEAGRDNTFTLRTLLVERKPE